MICAGCGRDLGALARVGRRDLCPGCGAELRSCRHCRHWDRRAAQECREPQAEPVLDKTRANFCDWFSPRADAPAAASSEGARAALDRLFRR